MEINEEIGEWRYVNYNIMEWNEKKEFVKKVNDKS